MKKILIIGNGGREDAICKALKRSPQNTKLYNFAPVKNPGINDSCEEIIIGNIMDLEAIKEVALQIKPDFAIVGPDDPIGNGATDALKEVGIPSFSPSKKCAQLESSKAFTRNLLKKYNVPGAPGFEVFTKTIDIEKQKNFYKKYNGKIVIKADGLLGGKGVLVEGDHFTTFKEIEDFSKKSIEKFGQVVFEEKLIGEEFSLISIVDGKTVLDTPAIQDHKRAFEGDKGPNTGGMGCISDEKNSLPFLTPDNLKDAHDITVKTMKAIKSELNEDFIGVMYGGFMVTKNGIKLIEYNARFGDPEALNILPILKTDFVDICEKAITRKLSEIGKLEFKPLATVVKYLCPEGYPDNPTKNVPIHINLSDKTNNQSEIFFASVAEEENQFILKGSRAIGILGIGKNLEEARKNCESIIPNITGPLFFRKDIGTKALIQERIDHLQNIL